MGIFSNILSKLGFGDKKEEVIAATPQAADPEPSTTAPISISEVDVVSKLENLAASNSEPLNWRESIVDLMKLLGLDSHLEARRELAQELNCPPDKMSDSAQMNVWLHKTVLQKLAENGGNIPAELLN
jgi:hypothetical protein